MAFISSTQVAIATGQAMAQFDFFCRPIIIYKQPTENVVSAPSDVLYGYGEEQATNSQVTYTNVSATHSGIIIYPFKNRNNLQGGYIDNKIVLDPNKTYIKVKQAGRDYILNGNKTEKLEFDGQTWNLESQRYQVQTYCGLNFYYFATEGTN